MSKFMKSLCKIAIPVTLQSMLQSSFSIVDQIMIGQLGETNISAVGLCGNFSLIFSVVIGAVIERLLLHVGFSHPGCNIHIRPAGRNELLRERL